MNFSILYGTQLLSEIIAHNFVSVSQSVFIMRLSKLGKLAHSEGMCISACIHICPPVRLKSLNLSAKFNQQ